MKQNIMNNSLFTQTFTRLKPAKFLASLVLLARLKHRKHSTSLSALILTTLLLAACGGGGGSSSGSGGAAAPTPQPLSTLVENFTIVPDAAGFTLSWTNPARDDIAYINLSWAAYTATDLSVRDTTEDGYVMLNNTGAVATTAVNSYNLFVGATTIGGRINGTQIGSTQISGAALNANNAYVFSLQLSFAGATAVTATSQQPSIPSPAFPRTIGVNTGGDASFADNQVYRVNDAKITNSGGNLTLSWMNPRVSAGAIASINLSYQSTGSSNPPTVVSLNAPAQLLSNVSAVEYTSSILNNLAPGSYDFTIQPILSGIFMGMEVAPGLLNNLTISGDTSALAFAAGNRIPTVVITKSGGLSDTSIHYPDDGLVQLTLDITQSDSNATPQLDAAVTISSGTCSITPEFAGASLYDASNQTSSTYNVTYTGAATAGGACTVNFAVTEDAQSIVQSRRIIFGDERAPALSSLTFNPLPRPAQLNVSLSIIATKQDGSNTTDVIFPRVVTSTGNCVATLASGVSQTRLYPSANVGFNTPAEYNVTSPNVGLTTTTHCGTFLFNVTEGSATVTSPLDTGISFSVRNDMSLAPTVTTDPVGAITDAYPDDGPVIYTLTITKRDTLPDPILNVTAGITGTCSTSPTGVTPLTYGAAPGTDNFGNQASTDYTITFNGTTTAGGTCNLEFVVTEDGQTTTITRSITFNPEQAPTLVVVLLGNVTGDSTNVPGNQDVRVSITATKQDGSNSRDIVFPATIMSSSMPSCTATLAGRPSRQYVMAGTSSVSVLYNVLPTIPGAIDNCGTFTFNATEGSVAGMSAPFSELISFVISDFDGDGLLGSADNCPSIANIDQSDFNSDGEGDVCDDSDNDRIVDSIDNCLLIANPGQGDLDGAGVGDVCDNVNDNDADAVMDADDVDVDGDGLIELRTAAQLNMMRYNLAGTNLTITADAGGNNTGCGGGRHTNGTAITACNGYEQMGNLDLNDLDEVYPGLSNWERIGSCDGTACTGSMTRVFDAIFNGNDYNISNMLIHITAGSNGVGFFGATSHTTELRNIHLHNIIISTENGVTSNSVGGLVGYTLTGDSGVFDAGIELQTSTLIDSSSATIRNINANGFSVGGLVGFFNRVGLIMSSYVLADQISSNNQVVGGLVGNVNSHVNIFTSYAIINNINGNFNVGGLTGRLTGNSIIENSYAVIGNISADTNDGRVGGINGGMLGSPVADISYSYTAVNMSVTSVGGLTGQGVDSGINSYWDSTTLTPPDTRDLNTFPAAQYGSGQATTALQEPLTASGIYAGWSGAWNFGTSSEYPALNGTPTFSPAQQREAARRALAGESPW